MTNNLRYSKHLFKLLFFLCGLTNANITGETITFTLEDPEWFQWGAPLPGSTSLANLIDSLATSMVDHKDRLFFDKCVEGKWQIDTIGKWHDRLVLEFQHTARCPSYNAPEVLYLYRDINAIAIATGNDMFRLVYAYITSEPWEIYFESTYVNQKGVLSTEARMAGMAGYRGDQYWIWDKDKNRPIGSGERGNRLDSKWLYLDAFERKYFAAPIVATSDSLIIKYATLSMNGMHYDYWQGAPITWKIDTLGVFRGYPLIRINYRLESEFSSNPETGKIVAVEVDKSTYRPLYVETTYSLKDEEEDGLLIIAADTLIVLKGFHRRGRTYSDNYWIWPKDSEAPVSLYQEWVLTETLGKINADCLPQGLSARTRIGNWDFRKLSYETYTWRKEDSDDHPSGGKLKIQFGIKDYRLVPLDFTFDSFDIQSDN